MVKPNGLQIKYKMFNNIHDFQLLLKCSRMLGLEMFHLKKKKVLTKTTRAEPSHQDPSAEQCNCMELS